MGIEDRYPNINITVKPNLEGDMILSPHDKAAEDILNSIKTLVKLDPAQKRRIYIVCGYSYKYDTDRLLKYPGIVHAERCTPKEGGVSNKVKCTFLGPPPNQINLGMWGKFRVEDYNPPLLRCHKCQKYGHHKNNCHAAHPVCGICSRRHDTSICLTKYKTDEPTEPRCPHCKQAHHSWNKRCLERLKRKYARRGQLPPNSAASDSTPNQPSQIQQHLTPANPLPNPTPQTYPSYCAALKTSVTPTTNPSTITQTTPSSQTVSPSMASAPSSQPKPQRPPKSPRSPRPTPSSKPQHNPVQNQHPLTPSDVTYTPFPQHLMILPLLPQVNNYINVLQWNILGIRLKYAILQSQVAVQRPDIILLQETLLREHTSFKFANYKIYRTHHTDISRGLLTLIKNTIPSQRITDIDCHEAETLSVQITLLNTTLTIHNIYKSPTRDIDATPLFADAETQSTVFSGDFNGHHPFLKSTSPTNTTGEHLYSLLGDFPGVKLLNNVDMPTHIAGGRLDLTFVSQDLCNNSSWDLHPVLTSDHFGTCFSLQLDKLPDPPPPPKRWNPDFAKWDLFEQHMTSWADRYSAAPLEDADNLLLTLSEQLTEAAASSMPMKKPFTKNYKDSWYYNPRIKAMNKRLNRIRKLFRRYNTDSLYQNLVVVTQHSAQVATEVKNEKWYDWCAEVNATTPLKKIWDWFNKVSGKRSTIKVSHPDPPAQALRLAQEFANRSKSDNLAPEARHRQRVLYPIRLNMITAACNISDDTDALYTMEELNVALSKTKDTAPGTDLITYSMLTHMGDPAKEIYLQLINKTHVERVRPRLWRQQDTQPVPKPKEENAYRPIALITCTEKVAERMVLNRLKWKIGKLHHRLYAFTDGVGTHECITDLMATINESHSLVVFLDLEKAFELASSAAILFSLVRKRVRGHLLSWVQEYTQGREARVTFQGATSPFLPLENGTPQGGILSPFLFNVLVENLLLIELPQGIEMFIYADDICIVCPHSVRIQYQSQKMQRALNAIVHECNELGLKINPLKTKAMAIKYFEPPPPLFIGNNPIEFINLHEDLEPPDHYIGKLIQTIRDVNIQLVILDVKHDKFHPEYVPPAPWSPNPIEVNYTVLPAFKSLCTPQQLKSAALASIADTSAANVYFTDGSVDMNLPVAGSAVFSNTFTSGWRLSDHASILQAELYAIAKALENSLYKYGHTTIHTDSKGAIQSILKRNFKENIHLISTIKTMATAHAQRNRKVTLNWIPSHVGIHGNDEADRLANSALSYPTISRACRPSLSHIKKVMSNYCHLQKKSLIRQVFLDGSRSAKWYTEVTNIIPHSMPKSLRRQLTTILFRLRLGYLCSWQIISIEDRPCPYCDLPTGTEPLEHYISTCTETFPLRQSINLPPPYTAVQVTKHILDNTNTLSGFLCSYPPPR
ncbi:uncharacterized protein [Palaemon carinicauda]|uniref:uncharacterized protein n=1 Tax=Palaemon carinicauda TaxID=392227 RepID=UPI0035B5D775